jgi:RNA polymerase sigma factor (sigma-70 family)
MPTSGRTTDPRLLEQVRDWRDSHAWNLFVNQYEPCLRALCLVYGLVGASADDCCQDVWWRLARRMRKFQYDPTRRFRGWVRVYFRCRINDFLKASRGECAELPMMGDMAVYPFLPTYVHDDEERDPEILAMLRRAEEVQDAVRARVTPDNWEVFRLIGIEGYPIPEAAEFLGREYLTVYRAYTRVSQKIADERRRRATLEE